VLSLREHFSIPFGWLICAGVQEKLPEPSSVTEQWNLASPCFSQYWGVVKVTATPIQAGTGP